VEARTLGGTLLSATTTAGGGHYTFPLTSLSNVVVTPIVPRSEALIPQQQQKVFNAGDQAVFLVRGTPINLHFSATPNTVIVLTTSTYTGVTPPSTQNSAYAYSGIVDKSGSLTLSVTGGRQYYLNCWITSQDAQGKTTYPSHHGAASTALNSLPGSTIPASGPVPGQTYSTVFSCSSSAN
jgi:hypothetical protein